MQLRSIFPMSNAGSQSILYNMTPSPEITIRPAYADDQLAVQRLASLDSATNVPPHPLLVAEVDGELRAGLSLVDGRAVADPFHFTGELVDLLRTRAQQLAEPESPRRAGRIAVLKLRSRPAR